MGKIRKNTPPITIQVRSEQMAIIEGGAKARGLTVHNFLLDVAVREAELALGRAGNARSKNSPEVLAVGKLTDDVVADIDAAQFGMGPKRKGRDKPT